MTAPRLRPADLLALAVAAFVVGSLALTWAARLTYAYDLEWMEGGMLAHAWRLANGEPLYVRPGPDFAPFVYPPGYPTVVAALGRVFGLAPWVGRLVSILGTLAAAAAAAWIVWRPHRDAVTAALSGAVFLGCYTYGGAFYDLVRPDGLLIGVLAWSVALALVPGDRHARLGSALLLCIACLVKHNAAFFGPALVLGIAMRDGWRAATEHAATAAVPTLLAVGVFQLGGDGLFLQYLVAVPASHPLVGDRLFPGAAHELANALPLCLAGAAVAWMARGADALPGVPRAVTVGGPMGFGVALALAAELMAVGGYQTSPWAAWLGLVAIGAAAAHGVVRLAYRSASSDAALAIALGASAFGMCVWMRAHSGGFANVHIPFWWLAAVGAGLALGGLDGAPRRVAMALFAAQLGLQHLDTDHAALRPTDADRAAGDRLVETLKGLKGPVWSPYAVWLPTYAGHAPQIHAIAVMDLDTAHGPLHDDLTRLDAAIAQHHFGAVVTSQRPIGHGLEKHYRLRTQLHNPAGALVPKSGWTVRLEAIWVPD
ncbi:MAG: hypothetical protein H6737_03115 [Alphaproteobacteria bacterium]|nr:hypothetical protein [Alphaproteobacteria bacterium]